MEIIVLSNVLRKRCISATSRGVREFKLTQPLRYQRETKYGCPARDVPIYMSLGLLGTIISRQSSAEFGLLAICIEPLAPPVIAIANISCDAPSQLISLVLVTARLALLGSEIPSRQAISIPNRKMLLVSQRIGLLVGEHLRYRYPPPDCIRGDKIFPFVNGRYHPEQSLPSRFIECPVTERLRCHPRTVDYTQLVVYSHSVSFSNFGVTIYFMTCDDEFFMLANSLEKQSIRKPTRCNTFCKQVAVSRLKLPVI